MHKWIAWTLLTFLPTLALAAEDPIEPPDKIVGMYIHQHWPYNHPYAARTWTIADWEGYVDGLQQLGFNTIKIWPVLETMPEPLTPSDVAVLDRIRQVIDIIHAKQMRVVIALCPNVMADDAVAGQSTFEQRYFFQCDLRVNPGDAEAVERLMKRREKLFRPLAAADAVAIIDSDPGGYPGSTNEEFVALLGKHRQMFDRLRPGIEILYWMHAGWPAYCRYYEKASFAMGEEREFADALAKLNSLNPEPWGLAGNIHYAKQAGLTDRAIDYRYGAVEAEPSFPLTNYGGEGPYLAAQGAQGRGVMANAQTHCLQLPYTFAFAQGAQGKPLSDADFLDFANRLLPGHGPEIVAGWSALHCGDPARMERSAQALDALANRDLALGPLKGLLFGDPQRFLTDIAMQLRLQAAYENFCTASEQDAEVGESFALFVDEFARWQQRHGYAGRAAWAWPRLDAALDKLKSPEIDAVRRPALYSSAPFSKVKEEYAAAETATLRLVEAMQTTKSRMLPSSAAAGP
jgi:hypothetical protein